jgi:hypothetical protein
MLDAVDNCDANREGRRPVPASIDTVGAGSADDGVESLIRRRSVVAGQQPSDRGGAAELGGDPGLPPQPARGLPYFFGLQPI